MKVTHDEAMSLLRSLQRPAAATAAAPSPELLRQAEVATLHLTGQPEWDVFLQRVQVFIDDERAKLAGMSENMPPTMTSEQVLVAHRLIIESKAKVDAWEQVLRLPKQLLAAKTDEAA